MLPAVTTEDYEGGFIVGPRSVGPVHHQFASEEIRARVPASRNYPTIIISITNFASTESFEPCHTYVSQSTRRAANSGMKKGRQRSMRWMAKLVMVLVLDCVDLKLTN